MLQSSTGTCHCRMSEPIIVDLCKQCQVTIGAKGSKSLHPMNSKALYVRLRTFVEQSNRLLLIRIAAKLVLTLQICHSCQLFASWLVQWMLLPHVKTLRSYCRTLVFWTSKMLNCYSLVQTAISKVNALQCNSNQIPYLVWTSQDMPIKDCCICYVF